MNHILAKFHRLVTCKIFGHNLTAYQTQNPKDPCEFYYDLGCFRCHTYQIEEGKVRWK